jgi:serine/threonine protein kinase
VKSHEFKMASNRQQALPVGTAIEGFEIRKVIGTGGFGITYLGFDTSLERSVAIKEYCPQGIAVRVEGDTTLSPDTPEMEEPFNYGLSRFLDEARTLARFHHPSIVRVHRFLEANGTGYLIMDFEEGRTLWQILRATAPMEERAVLDILMPILEGLDIVHEQSFLHRDIKPANILMRNKGVPVLLDFGAARLAMEQQAGDLTVMLTPGYAPLEQYSSTDQQGPWSDIYALGATAYHCMIGTAPAAATERVARLHGGHPDPGWEPPPGCVGAHRCAARDVDWHEHRGTLRFEPGHGHTATGF